MKLTLNQGLEWLGAAFGVAGNVLLALNVDQSKWAFLLFVASNAFLVAYAVRSKAWGLNAMYVMYTIITFIGIFRWILT